MEGEEPDIVSENGEASEDSDGGEMDKPELFPELHLLSIADQVAFEVDCNINIKSPHCLLSYFISCQDSDSPTVMETDAIISSAPSAVDNAEDANLEALFADW